MREQPSPAVAVTLSGRQAAVLATMSTGRRAAVLALSGARVLALHRGERFVLAGRVTEGRPSPTTVVLDGMETFTGGFDALGSALAVGDRDAGSVEVVVDSGQEPTAAAEPASWPLLLRLVVADESARLWVRVADEAGLRVGPAEIARQLRVALSHVCMAGDPTASVEIRDEEWEGRVLRRRHLPTRTLPPLTVVDLVAEQVRRRPDELAVVADLRLTYDELDRASAGVARALHEVGVGLGDVVAVADGRSAATVALLLGILRAGAVYLPLDDAAPPDVLAAVLGTARARILLTDARSRCGVVGSLAASCLEVDVRTLVSKSSEAPPPPEPGDLACVLFTSGSTGNPKGVRVLHRNLVSLVWEQDVIDVQPGEGVLHASSLAFDAAHFELWMPLANGGRIVVVEDRRPSLRRIKMSIRSHDVRVAFFTTSLFQLASQVDPDVFLGLRRLFIGGEVLLPSAAVRVARRLERRGVELWNVYGPTEATTFTTAYRVSSNHEETQPVPIGWPIEHRDVVIRDRFGHLAPPGVAGELQIGGDGVADGYTDAASTRESFVADPSKPDSVLYRTGDYGWYREDGAIMFLGRKDDEVKIRGHRVRLSEVERALAQVPGVKATVVLPVRNRGSVSRLAAAVETEVNGSLTADGLKATLTHVLPDYMVPATYVIVPSLPLTQNGKIDRRVLQRQLDEVGA